MHVTYSPPEKLSERECLMLGNIDGNAHLTVPELAQLLKIKTHSARRLLERLRERQIILGKVATIDATRLGYQEFQIRLSLSFPSQTVKLKMLKYLAQVPGVNVIEERGGEFQYALYMYAYDAITVSSMLKGFIATFGPAIVHKSIAVLLAYRAYNRKYFSSGLKSKAVLSYPMDAAPIELNAEERKSLAIFVQNPDMSIRDLARLLKIPQSTLQRRLAVMEKQRVIVGKHYRFDLAKLGIQFFCLEIYTQGIDPDLFQALHQFSLTHPRVIVLTEYMGVYDYELLVEVESASSVSRITEELLSRFPQRIQSIRPVARLARPHFSGYPFPG